MKKICFMLPFLWLAILSVAQQFVPTDANSSVKFRIKNLGVNVSGSFTGLKGSINFDPANVAGSAFDVSVNATSINTGIDKRDDHLRKEEYFDVKNYPILRFVSLRVMPGGKAGTYNMVGNLTIKNITKEITFPFTVKPENGGYSFDGEFKINRRDFRVGGSSFVMSDNLIVLLKVFARKA